MLNYIKLVRVPQWIKNLFVFVPLLFSQNIFNKAYFLPAFSAFLMFCLVSSIVYIFNDIVDIDADKLHPTKRNRPLPAGLISIRSSVITVIILAALVALFLPSLNIRFRIFLLSYFLLNVFYTFIFKHIVLLDIFSLAAGFMLRVVAGAVVISVQVSSWLILTTMFISLFLGVMKRRSELVLINEDHNQNTRKVLASYSLNFTDQMSTIAAAGVIICYALYTVSERTINLFKTENMIYTTPFVVFGIFRYMFLVYMNKKGENTVEIMLTDIPMIINVVMYIAAILLIIYRFSL
ncbi:MAG: decaprenyl-phosphate phosphoribosyltransferase [Ignavibacteriaceae bacterium]|nr:decaprenyl-phosphate phosphoribosyltransferase [Ignavibacteriaceae bacterium]